MAGTVYVNARPPKRKEPQRSVEGEVCSFFGKYRNAEERKGLVRAYWEVNYDSMSDDWTPEEISAQDLLARWAAVVEEQAYPSNAVPIFWYVESEGGFETLPFSFDHGALNGYPRKEDFLTFFSWPMHERKGDYLNWLELPVANKLWRRGRGDKGGFIQEATGWKPSPYQSHVLLDPLIGRRSEPKPGKTWRPIFEGRSRADQSYATPETLMPKTSIYVEGEDVSVITDARDERDFTEGFTPAFGKLLNLNGKHPNGVQRAAMSAAFDIVAKLRGYKSAVQERRVLASGRWPHPDEKAAVEIASADAPQVVEE